MRTNCTRHTQQSDAGQYACIATSPGGSGRAQVTVRPSDGRPRFEAASAPPADVAVPAGSPLRLECPGRAVGQPAPRVYWLKDSRPLQPGPGAGGGNASSLVVAYPTGLDSGLYRCAAESPLGYAESAPIRLRVYVDGGFSAWSGWGACSATCGRGATRRTRRCDAPRPQNGGQNCAGSDVETRECWERECIVRQTCAQFGHRCQDGCRDTELGFECVCPSGYSVAMGTGRCLDVDECLATAGPPPCPPQQQCLNTIGSYHCRAIQCPDGYVYDPRQR